MPVVVDVLVFAVEVGDPVLVVEVITAFLCFLEVHSCDQVPYGEYSRYTEKLTVVSRKYMMPDMSLYSSSKCCPMTLITFFLGARN
jgi:hypothetical protein